MTIPFELNRVHCLDCLEALKQMPDGCVDLVLTDPPYGMEYYSNRYVDGNPHKAIIGDDTFPTATIAECLRVARRAVYVFCRWNNMPNLPAVPKSLVVWVKDNWTAGDLQHEHGRMWEGIAFYPLAGHKFVRRLPDVLFAPRVPPTEHPTEKPVELIARLIAANEGDIILDPFMGSGTTGVAAVQLGRQFLGFEMSPEYCQLANDRITAARQGLTLNEYRAGQQSLF